MELREFPEPTPTPTGVVVDVAYCGVCGTDAHAFSSGRDYRPAVCGHEWTGTVSAVGREVTAVAEGDRVVVGVPPPCGSCDACRADRPAQCATALAVARGRDPGAPPHGGFAPRLAVEADRVIPAHEGLDAETLAQVEPVTVAVHAVHRSGLIEGDTVVVQGAGPVGLTTLQCARAAGAGPVIVVEPDPVRRALALDLGADRSVAPSTAAELISDHTGGRGADLVYECAGAADTVQGAVEVARRGGTVCLVGLADGPVSIDPGTWLRQEITVTAALAYAHEEFHEAMALLADGRVRVDALHTSTTRLEGLADLLDGIAHGTSGQLKVLVNPNW